MNLPDRSLVLLLLALIGFSWGACAQTAEELGMDRRSSFDASILPRDPFLPIGWVKPTAAAPVVVKGVRQEPVLRPEAFAVTSISVDRFPLAVINGKAYGEGESFIWTEGGRTMKIQVLSIRDGVVTLRFGDLTVKCPIRAWQKPSTEKPAAPKEGAAH